MRNQQGSIIIFSLLLLATMLGISLTLVNIFSSKIQSVIETSNSAKAIYAADTAIEACLFEARTQPATPIARPILTNAATFTIASLSATPVDVTNDCRPIGSQGFSIRGLGTYLGISRALEISQ